ncbi:MAG: hypothetical protein K5923_06435 [Clostridia bacterium]|nr:hypothetical protein [Clostridia bacterium]
MNKLKMNNKILTSILVIILLVVAAYSIATVMNTSDINTASAESIGLNGVVESGYQSSYALNAGAVAISNSTDLMNWFATAATEDNPTYGYLTADITMTSNTTYKSVKYHYLDGCGHSISITSASGTLVGGNGGTEDPIIAEDASFPDWSAWTSGVNYLDGSGNSTYGDKDSIIATYGSRATPFGLDDQAYGFYTAGYLGSIFAYSSMINTNLEFNGTFAFNWTNNHEHGDSNSNRGLSIGIMFGYLYNSRIDNCALTVNGRMCIAYGTNKYGQDTEGVSTVCMGGYAGTVDKSSYVTNSKITLAEGSFLSAYSEGTVDWGFRRNYPRTFVGGITGSLLSSTISNITATGSGNLRAWGGGETQDSGNNRMGCAGIIAGINVSSGPAGSAYTPENVGSNASKGSTATAGTINGVICSWTGIAMFLVGSSQHICGSKEKDLFYHGIPVSGASTSSSVCEHFYGGCICAAAAEGSVSGVFYTFEQSTLYDIAYDTYRYLRSDKSLGGDGYGTATATNSVGVQPVVFSNSIPSGNYYVLQMQQVDGTYAQTTGTYTRASYSGTDVTTITLGGNTYYINRQFTAKGAIANVQTDIFGLEWSSTSTSATIVAVVDATKISGYSQDSGLFVWSLDAYNGTANVASKACYSYATSMQDALDNYRQYEFKDSIMARNSSGANYTIKASLGYACTYLLNDDTWAASSEIYTKSIGSKTYDGSAYTTVPSIKLYTLDCGNNYAKTQMASNPTYTNGDIWAVYKQGSTYIYDFNSIQDAGTYTLRVNSGETSQISENFKYDFLDDTNRIVAYKADNKYYDANYATSLWQPTYTYTINQAELVGSWKSMSNAVDGGTMASPTDFVYQGIAYNFAYEKNTFTIPMTYETISYSRVASINLEMDNIYYLEKNGAYTSVGTYVINGDNKYFLTDVPTGVTFYKQVDNGGEIEYVAESPLEIGTTYYTLSGETYTKFGEYVQVNSDNYFKTDINSTIYYKRVYKPANDVKDVGDYRITVCDCTNQNYYLTTSLQREWFVTVSPRTVYVQYRGLDDLVYNAQEQRATWIITDHSGAKKAASSDTVKLSEANIIISDVFEAAAIQITYDDNYREYITSGEYYVTISLASGAVANNYYLPTTTDSIKSLDGEDIFDDPANEIVGVVRLDEVEGNVVGVTRIVTIKKADVSLLRQYEVDDISDAAFIDSEYGTAYNYYDAITTPTYVQKSMKFMNDEPINAYYEVESYKGYNTVACVIKGVLDANNAKYFDLIYCDPLYYPATWDADNNMYVVEDGAEPVSVVTKRGVYVAKIAFDTDAYINYNANTFYVIYEVEGVTATISIDYTGFLPAIEYDAIDRATEFTNMASVSGLVKVDLNKGANVEVKFYKLNNDKEYGANEDYIELSTDKYELVDSVRNVGKYIIVVAHDSISENSYTIVYNYASGLDPLPTINGNPYFAITISSLAIKVSVGEATKVYSKLFTYSEESNNIEYTLLLDELNASRRAVYDRDAENLVAGFTSDGFATSAEVGTYDIVAAFTGSSAQNYVFTVQEHNTFSITKSALKYRIANINKTYGTVFEDTTITEIELIDGIPYELDEIASLTIDSTGMVAAAKVSSADNQYTVTAVANGTRASNYDIEVVCVFTVVKKELTILTATAASDLVYSGSAKDIVVAFDGVFGTDIVTAVATYNNDAAIKPINVGEYSAIVTSLAGADAANYSITANTTADVEFAITTRAVEVTVKDFTMGYKDIKLAPAENDKGYNLLSLLDFAESDIENGLLILTFETLEASQMDKDPGVTTQDCVTLTISGDAATNYVLTVSGFGDLTVLSKNIETVELKNASTKYTGSDLKTAIELDTASEDLYIAKYEKEVNGVYEEVEDVIGAGSYRVTVRIKEGADATLYDGDEKVLAFTVEKADWTVADFKASDITAYYNKLVFGGSFAGYEIMVSKDGIYDENYVVTDTVSDLKSMTKYTFYVKIGASENYNESAVMTLEGTTTYDPNKINDALATIGSVFSYSKVSDYQKILQAYAKVAEGDKELINAKTFNAAADRYNLLMNAGSKAISITKTIAGKTSNKTFEVVSAAAISSVSLACLGLSCLFIKRKKNDKVEEEK